MAWQKYFWQGRLHEALEWDFCRPSCGTDKSYVAWTSCGAGGNENSGLHTMQWPSPFFLDIQGISIRPFPGLVNFVLAVAYLFCLNMPAAFSQPGNGLIEIPCICGLCEYAIWDCRWKQLFCPIFVADKHIDQPTTESHESIRRPRNEQNV